MKERSDPLTAKDQTTAPRTGRPLALYLLLGTFAIVLCLLGFSVASRYAANNATSDESADIEGHGKTDDPYIEGRIVSVRGNIVQMHPKWGGTLLRLVVDSRTPIRISGQAAPLNALRIGMYIGGKMHKMSDDVVRPNQLDCHEKPGAPGVLFGTVLAVHDRTLTVRPRFTKDRITVTLTPNAQLTRQIQFDPDSIKVGDTVTVWGGKSDRDVRTDLTAYVFLVGRQAYPRSRPESRDPNDQLLTGTVTALHPFTLTPNGADPVTITVPGEIPLSNMSPMPLTDISAGSKVMLIGDTAPDGNMQASMVIRDAPLVVGLGD